MSGPPGPIETATEARDAAAERARAAARESVHWLREEGKRLYDNYSKQSVYFKWRAWIIGGYVLIAIASLIGYRIAAGPSNDIGAYITWTRDLNGRLLVAVENNSPDDWTAVQVLLDDKYVFELARVAAHQRITPNASQFRPMNAPPKAQLGAPANFTPKRVRVDCDQGAAEARSE